jgi:hypothetical protein
MNISIFGLGYVGAVISACFAQAGHRVIGVDTDATKVGLINGGKSPIIEEGLEELIASNVTAGRLSATTDGAAALATTELTMVCVGTPSKTTGELDLTYVDRVCESIGRELTKKKSRHVVVVRSTMLPGSMRGTVIPALERGAGQRTRNSCASPPPSKIFTTRPRPSLARYARWTRTRWRNFTRICPPWLSRRNWKPPRWSNTWTTSSTRSKSLLPTKSAQSANRSAWTRMK